MVRPSFVILTVVYLVVKTSGVAVNVAVCVAGQARSFWQERVHSTLFRNLWTLQNENVIVDLFLAFSADDAPAVAQNQRVMLALRPRTVKFDVASDCDESNFRFCKHWLALPLCLSMILNAEQALRLTYHWVLRVRPDAEWLAAFPRCSNLDNSAIHARFLCPGTAAVKFHEMRWGLDRNIRAQCWASQEQPLLFSCVCPLWGCPSAEYILDDMAAWVPRALLESYFSNFESAVENRRSHGLEFHLSSRLNKQGIPYRPLAFQFAIVREDGAQDHYSEVMVGSETSFTCDVQAVALIQYREVCRPSFADHICDNVSRAAVHDPSVIGESNLELAKLRVWIADYWNLIQDAGHFDEREFTSVMVHFLQFFCAHQFVILLRKVVDVRGGRQAQALIYYVAHGLRQRKNDVFVTADAWEAWLREVKHLCQQVADETHSDELGLDVKRILTRATSNG